MHAGRTERGHPDSSHNATEAATQLCAGQQQCEEVHSLTEQVAATVLQVYARTYCSVMSGLSCDLPGYDSNQPCRLNGLVDCCEQEGTSLLLRRQSKGRRLDRRWLLRLQLHFQGAAASQLAVSPSCEPSSCEQLISSLQTARLQSPCDEHAFLQCAGRVLWQQLPGRGGAVRSEPHVLAKLRVRHNFNTPCAA